MQGKDECIEPVEPVFPKLFVLRKPVQGRLELCSVDTARSPLGVAALGNEPGFFEHLDVLGYRRQAHGKWRSELIDRGFTFGQPRQHSPTGRVG